MAVIAQGELKVARTPDVRFGSNADISLSLADVRYSPKGSLYGATNYEVPIRIIFLQYR